MVLLCQKSEAGGDFLGSLCTLTSVELLCKMVIGSVLFCSVLFCPVPPGFLFLLVSCTDFQLKLLLFAPDGTLNTVSIL